jgi:hypothetical protein
MKLKKEFIHSGRNKNEIKIPPTITINKLRKINSEGFQNGTISKIWILTFFLISFNLVLIIRY